MQKEVHTLTPPLEEPSVVSPPKQYASPFRLLVLVAASVFVAEAALNLLFTILPPVSPLLAILLDSCLLVISVFPALYLFLLRPLTLQMDERRRVEAALHEAQSELEMRVQERTAELTLANRELQHEILERQHMEVKLRESEELYRKLITASPDAITVIDEQGRITFASARMMEAFGYGGQDEIIGGNLLEAIAVNDRAKAQAMFDRLLDGSAAIDSDHYTLRRKDGRTFIGEVDSASLLDASGTPKGVVLITRDITERTRVEEQMRLQTTALQSAANAIVITGLDGTIQWVNAAFTHLTGYNAFEAIGRNPRLLKSGKHDQAFYRALWDTILAGNVWHGEVVNKRKDGRLYSEEMTITPVTNIGGVITQFIAVKQDITARKQAEERLSQQHATLQAVIESSEGPIFSIDRNYRYTSFNSQHAETMKALFGADIEIGHNILDYHTNPDDRIAAQENFDRALSGGSITVESYAGEITRMQRYFEISHNPIRASGGEVIGVAVYARNLTERKRMEEALRRAHNELELRVEQRTQELARANAVLLAEIAERKRVEEQVRVRTTAMAAAANGILITDRRGTIEWCNPALSQMTGYSAEELIGQNPRLLQSGQQARDFYERLWSTILSGQTWHGEIVNRRKDGSLYTEEQTIAPVLDENDEIMHFIAIKQDITDRKRADNLIRLNAARAEALSEVSRALVEASLDYQTVLDAVAHGAGRMVGGACVIYLLSEDEQWLNLASVYHANPDTARILQQLLAAEPYRVDAGLAVEVTSTGQPLLIQNVSAVQLQDVVKFKFDAQFDLNAVTSLLIVPLRLSGKLIGTVTVWRDQPGPPFTADDQLALQRLADRAALAIDNAQLYTDLQRALQKEQDMRRQLVQAETFAAMGRIVAAVAHELNNPLQTIRNCLFLLQQEIQPDAPMHEYFHMAATEFERLANLVAQLRALQRSRVPTPMQPFDLCKLIDVVHTLLQPQLQANGIRWQSSIETSRCDVVGTVDQLKQVCLNIGLNAIEAMQRNGGMLRVDLIPSIDGERIGVRFQDTGPGIAPENLTKVFEPLFTTKPNGLGLGLPICYEIVQRHNGGITVDSEPGHGATFTVWLPAA